MSALILCGIPEGQKALPRHNAIGRWREAIAARGRVKETAFRLG